MSDWGRVNVLDPVGAATQRGSETKKCLHTDIRQFGPNNDRATGTFRLQKGKYVIADIRQFGPNNDRATGNSVTKKKRKSEFPPGEPLKKNELVRFMPESDPFRN